MRGGNVDTLVQLVREGRISRREFFGHGMRFGLSISALGAILAACSDDGGQQQGDATGTSTASPVAGGTLITGVVNAVGALDPHGWSGFTSNIATNHIFSSLVRLNFDTSEIEPALAESWEQPDATTYIYTLRHGITFHNGDPVTPEDVIFSIERSREVSWGAYGLAQFQEATALDDRTVEIKLSNPDWTFPWFFYWPPGAILSKKYFDEVGDTEATEKPVGAGPFKFVRASQSEVVLERFEDYWEDGVPMLDGVELRVVDESTLISALGTGEIHLSADVGFDQLSVVEGFEGTTIKARVGPHIVMTYLNMTEAPFDDIKVRQAMAEALDNTAALSAYSTEWYQPSNGAWIHPSFEYSIYDETNAVYTQDLEKARALLAESSVPDGFTATWTVAATRPQELSAVLGAQERLKEIGINIEIDQRPDPDVAAATFTRPRPYEIITYNWLHNQPHALDPMAALLTTAALEVSNFPGYSNPEYDQAIADAYVATDTDVIADRLAELQRIQVRDVPLLVHGWDAIRRIEGPDVQGPEQTILGQWDDWFRTTHFVE
jgi:peptide/nickel transport system substrate-binding protein